MTQVVAPPAPPVPPVPPMPPMPEAIVIQGGGPGLTEALMILAVMLVGAVLLLPLVRALARRIEGGGSPLERRVEELERRLAQVETRAPVTGEVDLTYQRLHELEDRVDFAERLLAQQRPPGQLGAGGDR